MMMLISFFLEKSYFFQEKFVSVFQSCYKILFTLFNLIVPSLYFGKLVKIPENASALHSVLLRNNIEYDNMLMQYLIRTGWNLACSCYLGSHSAVSSERHKTSGFSCFFFKTTVTLIHGTETVVKRWSVYNFAKFIGKSLCWSVFSLQLY